VENCASGGVVLITADPSARWQGFERSVQCDSNDRFEVNSLRPGDYYAVAFPSAGPTPAWPDRFDDVLKQGALISVHAGETHSTNLRLAR
jgi:hypothetical protein